MFQLIPIDQRKGKRCHFFGKDATKSGIGSLLGGILFLAIIATIASACGII